MVSCGHILNSDFHTQILLVIGNGWSRAFCTRSFWVGGLLLETAEHCADQQGNYAVCHRNEREAAVVIVPRTNDRLWALQLMQACGSFRIERVDVCSAFFSPSLASGLGSFFKLLITEVWFLGPLVSTWLTTDGRNRETRLDFKEFYFFLYLDWFWGQFVMKFVILSFPVDYEVHGDRCVCLCFLPGFSIVTSVYWLLSIWAELKQPNIFIFHLCIVIAVIKSKVNIGLLKPQLYVHRSNAIVSTYVIKQGYVSVEYFYSLLTPFIMGSYVWHRSSSDFKRLHFGYLFDMFW